jgi:hypothetical protein
MYFELFLSPHAYILLICCALADLGVPESGFCLCVLVPCASCLLCATFIVVRQVGNHILLFEISVDLSACTRFRFGALGPVGFS